MNKFVFISFFISFAAIFYLFYLIDFTIFVDTFTNLSPIKLLPCIILYIFIHLIRVIRWKILLKPLANTTFTSPLSFLSISLLANNILPSHLGEFVRVYLLATEYKISKSSVLATVVVERIYDGLTVLFILLLFLLFVNLPDSYNNINFSLSRDVLKRIGLLGLLFFGGFLICMRLIYKYQSKTFTIINSLLRPFPKFVTTKVIVLFQNFISGLKLTNKQDLIKVILLSLLAWILQCIWAYSPTLALGFNIPSSSGFLMTIALTFALLIPSAPAFVGTFQMAVIVSLSCYGLDQSQAAIYSIVLWGIYLLCSSFLGLIFTWKTSFSWRHLNKKYLLSDINN
jgi:uncharacterized protein (TIRG00374 family)